MIEFYPSKLEGSPLERHRTDKVMTICYALGWTQHSHGSQNIRTMAMIQLLLGNIGRPGGGVNALRGHANVQGVTDMNAYSEVLSGYLSAPTDADTTVYVLGVPSIAPKRMQWDRAIFERRLQGANVVVLPFVNVRAKVGGSVGTAFNLLRLRSGGPQ